MAQVVIIRGKLLLNPRHPSGWRFDAAMPHTLIFPVSYGTIQYLSSFATSLHAHSGILTSTCSLPSVSFPLNTSSFRSFRPLQFNGGVYLPTQPSTLGLHRTWSRWLGSAGFRPLTSHQHIHNRPLQNPGQTKPFPRRRRPSGIRILDFRLPNAYNDEPAITNLECFPYPRSSEHDQLG